jgi:hypothetical protein
MPSSCRGNFGLQRSESNWWPIYFCIVTNSSTDPTEDILQPTSEFLAPRLKLRLRHWKFECNRMRQWPACNSPSTPCTHRFYSRELYGHRISAFGERHRGDRQIRNTGRCHFLSSRRTRLRTLMTCLLKETLMTTSRISGKWYRKLFLPAVKFCNKTTKTAYMEVGTS